MIRIYIIKSNEKASDAIALYSAYNANIYNMYCKSIHTYRNQQLILL
jgi:hypothetical protein